MVASGYHGYHWFSVVILEAVHGSREHINKGVSKSILNGHSEKCTLCFVSNYSEYEITCMSTKSQFNLVNAHVYHQSFIVAIARTHCITWYGVMAYAMLSGVQFSVQFQTYISSTLQTVLC